MKQLPRMFKVLQDIMIFHLSKTKMTMMIMILKMILTQKKIISKKTINSKLRLK